MAPSAHLPPRPDDHGRAKPSRCRPTRPFWQRKRLHQMTPSEWESLCDGCGKCCLEKLQWGPSGAISHTDVACRLLDLDTCRCRSYARSPPPGSPTASS